MGHISPNGTRPSAKGPAETFIGSVRVDPLFQVPDPGRAAGALVTFEPGARSNWHTHPRGQTLIVISGIGWTQCEGEPKQEIRPGDVIWCPPGEKHWHGATSANAMSHIAIQEHAGDGNMVDWLEPVTDGQYLQLKKQEKLSMSDKPAATRSPFGDIAPALAAYTDDVLFGDVWKRAGLSPRDRSLVTVACLISLYRTNELPFHMKRALENGVTREELAETITHLAFYAGWPPASTAVDIARKVFEDAGV